MSWTAEDRDRARAALIALVEALPSGRAEDAYGHTGFFAGKKRFAWLLVDHHGDGRLAVCIKAPPGELEALVEADPRQYFVPAYLGANGWVGVNVDPTSNPDWKGIAALLEQGWRMSAGKRAIAELDARRRGGT